MDGNMTDGTAQTYELLSKLDHVQQKGQNQWSAQCPIHKDLKNSLGVTVDANGRIACNCLAGCETADMLKHFRLGWSALFPNRDYSKESPTKPNKKIDGQGIDGLEDRKTLLCVAANILARQVAAPGK